MKGRRHSLQVSTFPFLAVLLCAMGSLILLLLVLDQKARQQRAEEINLKHAAARRRSASVRPPQHGLALFERTERSARDRFGIRLLMPRRKAWGGSPPADDHEARRRLIEVTRTCIEEYGYERASLGEVAKRSGVTRQTVYRLFPSSEDLFHSAATLASGGALERIR